MDMENVRCALCSGKCRFYDSWYGLVVLIGGFLALFLFFNMSEEINSPGPALVVAI